jgi:hypothetical protein
MSHLDDADYVPPVGWRQAIRLLCDPQSPAAWPQGGYDAFREALEDRFAVEVDQFAAQFFSLPRGPRRVAWTQLLKHTEAFPRLRARLRSMQPGLEAESAMPEDQNQQDSILVERICRLFVLKPGAHNAQRRQWLAAMTDDWRPAVRRVRAKYPKLARLDADLLSALESAHHRDAAAMKSTSAVATQMNLAAAFIKKPKASAGGTSPTRTRTTANSNSRRTYGNLPTGSLVGILLFVIIRAIAQFSGSQSSQNYQSPPSAPSSQEIDRIMRNLRAPSGTEGSFPNGSSPWPSGNSNRSWKLPDNQDEMAKNFERLGLTPPATKDDPRFSSPFLRDTPPKAGPCDGATRGPRLPPSPSPPSPPGPTGPMVPGPPQPGIPRGSPP